MSAALTLLDPHFRDIASVWVSCLEDAGVQPTVTSTRRDIRAQQALYDAFVHGRSKYPAAYPGTSLHEWGLAFDVETVPHAALFVLGPLWERIGLGKWGGHFTQRDEIHFEAGEAVKKAAGWVKGAVYEAPLEKVSAPWEPSGPGGVLVSSLTPVGSIVSGAEDFLGKLLGL